MCRSKIAILVVAVTQASLFAPICTARSFFLDAVTVEDAKTSTNLPKSPLQRAKCHAKTSDAFSPKEICAEHFLLGVIGLALGAILTTRIIARLDSAPI